VILLEFSILWLWGLLFKKPGIYRVKPGNPVRWPELPGSAPGSAARRTGEEDPHELVANWPIEIDDDYRTENSMVDLDKWRIVTVITRWYMIWYNIKFCIMYMRYIYTYVCVTMINAIEYTGQFHCIWYCMGHVIDWNVTLRDLQWEVSMGTQVWQWCGNGVQWWYISY
jgi:hypothetical protein